MRYLYGDSAPFPHKFNFLKTLESFMIAGSRIVQLESESRTLQLSTAATATARTAALEELEAFHNAAMRALEASAASSALPHTTDYSRQVVDYASGLVESSKRNAQTANGRDEATVRAEVDRRRIEIREALSHFFVVGHLPTLDVRVQGRCDGSFNVVTAVVAHPDGIVVDVQLATGRVGSWQAPRRVADFVPGLNLMVGMKRGLFNRTATSVAVNVDDFVLTAFELSETAATMHLRKRNTDRDAYIFTLTRTDGGELSNAEVARPLEDGPESGAMAVDPADLVPLQRLWQSLRLSVDPLIDHRERLNAVRLDGEDVFEHDLTIMLVERMIRYLAPTVAEIGKRSPNPAELSLKVEDDSGRREEIYLKKDDVVARLQPLGDKERAIFYPLGLVPQPTAPAAGVDDIAFDDWDK